METFRQSSSSYYSIYSSAPTDFSKSNSCMRTSIKEFSHFDSKERRFLKKTKLNFNSTAIKSRRSNKRLIASMALHQRSSYSSLNNQFLSLSQQQSLLSLKKTFKSHLSHVSTRGLSHGPWQGTSKRLMMPKIITSKVKSLQNRSLTGLSDQAGRGPRKTYLSTQVGL